VKYFKYHGLGNDYIVLKQSDLTAPLNSKQIVRICHRNYGVGGDGLLLLADRLETGFVVHVFNPDGSEAENSGNGMRIMSRFLFDIGLVKRDPFNLLVKGERKVTAQIFDPGDAIEVEMGKASFLSSEIPVAGPRREVLNEKIELLGETLTYSCVNVGNPHCVVFGRNRLKEDALTFGPILEVHERFPHKSNVQFAQVTDRHNIQLEIWERGAGYTLASGSSASAVASIARHLNYVEDSVTMHMAGGSLQIKIRSDFSINLRGPVTKVAEGDIDAELFLWNQDL
jgi:diaminopimelate epimerase